MVISAIELYFAVRLPNCIHNPDIFAASIASVFGHFFHLLVQTIGVVS